MAEQVFHRTLVPCLQKLGANILEQAPVGKAIHYVAKLHVKDRGDFKTVGVFGETRIPFGGVHVYFNTIAACLEYDKESKPKLVDLKLPMPQHYAEHFATRFADGHYPSMTELALPSFVPAALQGVIDHVEKFMGDSPFVITK